MSKVAAIVSVLAGVLFTGTLSFAQSASVTGRVTDNSEAVLSDVKVTFTNNGTSIQYPGITNEIGLYSVTNLPAGNYAIVIEKQGFKTINQSNLTIHVQDTLQLNFQLTIGDTRETVTVQAQNMGVQLTSSSINAVVDSTTVRELPLNGRDWTQLATLQPGVVSDESEQDPIISVQRGLRGYGAQLSISGNRPQSNNYRLDGISINDYSNSGPGSVTGGALGVDAIQEFSVETSNYFAEFGRTSGGVISAVSRSGTNELHGNVYEFLRNSALDARNYFDGPSIPEFRRNQFGASVGGPVVKDRAFFFADYEGLRQSLGFTQISDVPSVDARNGIIHNADGTTTILVVDPSVAKSLAIFPLPNGPLLAPGNTGLFSLVSNQITTENFVTARVDQKITDADSIFGTYQFDKAQINLPDAFNTVLYGSGTGRQFVTLQESHIFSPTLFNSARFGFSRYTAQDIEFLKALSPVATDPSLAAVPDHFAPALSVPGLTTYTGGIGTTSYERLYYNSFQFYDDMSLSKGRHNLKLGFNVERIQDNNFEDAVGGGAFLFGSLSGYLTNQPTYFYTSLPSPLEPRYLRQTIWGGYIQDDFRFRPNLTINAGLRYEMATVLSETEGRLSSLPSVTALTPRLGNPLYSNPTLRNFEPRIGIVWDPFGDGKTSVRSGFGIFDVLPLHYEFELPELITYPWDALETTAAPPPGSFPGGAYPSLELGDVTMTYVDPHPKRNYVMQWNFSLQRQLTSSVTTTVSYVGSRGNHDSFTEDNANWVYPEARTPEGYIWPIPGTGIPINPNHGRIDALTWPSNNSYNALEVQVEKRMSHGLQVQGNYTWGKSIDEGSTAIAGDQFANSILNLFPFDPKLRRAVSDYNIAQNGTANFTWILPNSRFSGVEGWALGGWQLGSIFQARTGTPFTPQIAGDPLGQGTGDGIDFPDRIRSSGCSTAVNPRNVASYLKLNCFTLPVATSTIASLCVPFPGAANSGTCQNLLGNGGRNSVVGPGLVDLDFSLFKNNRVAIAAKELNIQYRAEFFNVLNRANFAPPVDNQSLFDQTGGPVAGAGRLDSTSTTSRQIQFAIKVIW
jgi:hypothetical protein